MKSLKYLKTLLIYIVPSLLLSGCVSPRTPSAGCTVLFEDNPSLYLPAQIYEVGKLEDLSLSVGVPRGERISSVSYEDYSVSGKTGESLSYDYYTLTLHQIRYPAVIRLTTSAAYTTALYPGGGEGGPILLEDESPHLRFNTPAFRGQFSREGCLPVGWNTEPDGGGTHIGFGSRIDRRDIQHLKLYMEWLPCTAAEEFSYRISDGRASVTGCRKTGDIVIPDMIEGCPVVSIEENAFGDVEARRIALPASLETVAPHAFGNVTVEDLYFYDNIISLPEEAFESYRITRLHVNAASDPVYSGSYFDTLSDKMDYLDSLRDRKKIVLFGGSSARFGYDSPRLEAAFPGCRVVNMGVYAYSNMLPLARLILTCIGEGDILLSAPELDAIEEQFCGETALDRETFCMLESNYDMLARLDCREFTGIFSAFMEYAGGRRRMTPRSYCDSPSFYDEEGNPQGSLTYNKWGDYILFRENNEDRKAFGVKRAFYNISHIRGQDLNGLNAVYDAFRERGAQVFFAFSPRSRISVSEDSTQEAVRELDKMLRERLHARVISSAQASLMDPLYFYGTDNHLSTEGAQLYTDRIIECLRAALEEEP